MSWFRVFPKIAMARTDSLKTQNVTHANNLFALQTPPLSIKSIVSILKLIKKTDKGKTNRRNSKLPCANMSALFTMVGNSSSVQN